MSEKQIGHISHWFGNLGVVVIDVDKGTLTVGDTIHVKGNTTDFTQTIESMQLDGEIIKKAKKGMSVGVKAPDRARRTDLVFKVAD
tara:strand:- start:1281 stop:1538 length:258 start_codon:yes stop_codon:yes gene_type:complete